MHTSNTNKEGSGRIFENKRDARIVIGSVVAWVIALILVWGISFGGFQGIALSFDGSRGMLPANAQPDVDEMTKVDDDEMVVSVSPEPRLVDGMLRLNFVVLDLEGATAERIVVEQGDEVVFQSGVVQPGNRLEWVSAPEAKPGTAMAEVYAVNAEGNDYGTPTVVEVRIDGE